MIFTLRLKKPLALFSYERDDQITSDFSAISHGRVIWGGDISIKSIKGLPSPAKAIDITFSDRYSMAILNSEEVLKTDSYSLSKLARDFIMIPS